MDGELIRKFNESKPKNIRLLRRKNPRIASPGRLCGISSFNEWVMLKYATMDDGKKMIMVCHKANENEPGAMKTTPPSTGTPYIVITRLCKIWFGDDRTAWNKNLKLIDSCDGNDLYEVIEKEAI